MERTSRIASQAQNSVLLQAEVVFVLDNVFWAVTRDFYAGLWY